MKFRVAGVFLIASIFSSTALVAQVASDRAVAAVSNSAQTSVLSAVEAGKIFPASVFFKGQTASVQSRNSGGVRFGDKSLMIVSLIDTSGYSSQVQEKYQAYLMTESAVEIDGHRLAPGAYGCGFVSGDSFVVMDIGGHDLFTAHTMRDAGLRRPTPLQVTKAPDTAGGYRLYAGRSYVTFRAVAGN
jgi:hypothetical protein